MKKITLVLTTLVAASFANANVPSGLTGLWRFEDSGNKYAPTIGANPITSTWDNSWFTGPWTVINPGYSDNGVLQDRSFDFLTVNPGFSANGGGAYVNEYTISIDYVQTSGLGTYDSFFQTANAGNDNDGDLWINPSGQIGVGSIGYSAQSYDPSTWHRITWSVDNGNFFRVYVDGALFLDGAGQAIDGRWALYPDHFHLLADNDWEDDWGLIGNVMTWGRALSSQEVAGMGGWIDGAQEPTALIVPEPATLSLGLLGGALLFFRRKRR